MSVPFDAYQGKEPYIFVSYAHKDRDIVYNEIKRLHEEGYRIWYDEGIQPSNEWSEEIAVAINNCLAFLVFISPQSIESVNVCNEINYALRKKKKFIAIHIVETILPPGLELQMGSIQAIMKFQMHDDQYFRKLVNTFHSSVKEVNINDDFDIDDFDFDFEEEEEEAQEKQKITEEKAKEEIDDFDFD